MDEMTAKFNIRCTICGKRTIISVDLVDYADYISGAAASAESAFKYLSDEDRKCIRTRKCAKCQKLVDIIK